MTIDMSQFFQVFFDETEELLAEMEKLLLAIDVQAPDAEDLNAIFRAAHSIKGGASTFGITDLTDITHVLETLLDLIRKGHMHLTSEHVDVFLDAKDILKMQLEGHRQNSPVDIQLVTRVRSRLEALSQIAHEPSRPYAIKLDSAPIMAPEAMATEPGMRRFQIGLPTVPQKDVTALAAELGLLGSLMVTAAENGNAVFILNTTEDADAIVAICSFVMEPSDIKIDELTVTAFARIARSVIESDAFKALRETEQGYGFFEPVSLPHLATARQSAAPDTHETASRENAQGYGFFAPFVPLETAQPADQILHSSTSDSSHSDDHSGIEKMEPATGESNVSPESSQNGGRREPEKMVATSETSSLRVSIEKVDQLINLVGELVITQAMIEQRTEGLDPMLHERLLGSVNQLTRNTRDLQEAVLSIRMMPMDYVFSRFPRMVRDLATKLGKKVEFMTHGAATELDKGLIERIIDPLTHLVRNSIDHGIEIPLERIANGKTEMGRLSLSASHQGGNIIIEVTDDGAGLSRDRILRKAREQGLPENDAMTDAEVWQLIFAPGFSTADVVTDISGRGVGMDVVKRNITAMGGTVDIRSAQGYGTTTSIALPLTLAILDGMSVRVGDEIYILPLGYVIESLQPDPVDVKEISGQGTVIHVRGDYLPLILLHRLFGIVPQHTSASHGIVVILESEGRKAALLVDDLVGQQQVVVKNIESNYRKVAGISGATILGDGGVALIIDVAAILRSSQKLTSEIVLSS